MWRFYCRLLWASLNPLDSAWGWLQFWGGTVVAMFVTSLLPSISSEFEDMSPLWALVPLGLAFGVALLRVNYMRYKELDDQVEELRGRFDFDDLMSEYYQYCEWVQEFSDTARHYYVAFDREGDFDRTLAAAPHYGATGDDSTITAFAHYVYPQRAKVKDLASLWRMSAIGAPGRQFHEYEQFHSRRRWLKNCWEKWTRLGADNPKFRQFFDETLREHEGLVKLVGYLDVAYHKLTHGEPLEKTEETGWGRLAKRWESRSR
jgi:hypothetical protein